MERVREINIRYDLILLSVGADLFSIHADHGDLDWAHNVEVVVAQVIGWGLELILRHTSWILYYLVKDRSRSAACYIVRDHVEIKNSVSFIFDYGRVNYCATARVEVILALFDKNALVNVAVNQAVKNFGLVSWRDFLKKVINHLYFVLLDISLKGWTSNTISVNDYFFRKFFIDFLIISHGIIDKTLNYICSLLCYKNFFYLSPGFTRILILVIFRDFWLFLFI